MCGYVGLHEQDGSLWVHAAGQKLGGFGHGVLPELGWVPPTRERVEVDDAIEGVVGVLQFHPMADGAQIVADVARPSGLDPAEDSTGRLISKGTAQVYSPPRNIQRCLQ
jgi:hypothetical protein